MSVAISTRYVLSRVLAVVAVLLVCVSPTWAQDGVGLEGTVEGVLSLVWGDGPPEAPSSVGPFAMVTDDSGRSVQLLLDEDQVAPMGGMLGLNGRRVNVRGSWAAIGSSSVSTATLAVAWIGVVEGGAPATISAVKGSQPWVSIMCKFNDIAAEPEDLAYFQNMYGISYPGLDHYWRQASYDQVNVVGSSAHGWYTLPHNRDYYVPGGSADLNALFNDCTAVASADVNFSNYVGINLMFNETFGPYAWGGSRGGWRVTWEPPWGWGNVTVMSHEMGHGFGLPHSCFDPGATYDNVWDVMSDAWGPTLYDSTYGELGQHTITYHKDALLGWLRAPEKRTVDSGDSTTVALERLSLPYSPGPKTVKVPIGGSTTEFYTVEARRLSGYDAGLPGNAAIIHEIEIGRGIPAYVQGANGNSGAMWTPGELFRDDANDIGIAVTRWVDHGVEVAIGNGSPLAASYPQLDAHAGAGTSSNLNGVFEPGESVLFEPAWTNVSVGTLNPTGSLSGFTGPGGAAYTVNDGAANYGSVVSVDTASCRDTGNCYRLSVSNPAVRPATHWDASVTETLSSGATKTWTLHLGSSFGDVGMGHWAYGHIESLLHSGITAGCGGGDFCPESTASRWQIAVFLSTALAGGAVPTSGSIEGLGSYNCVAGGTSVFSDVPPGDSGCRFIHYLASRKIVAGCGGGKYCPSDPVNRWEVAVFLATSMAGTAVPSTGTVPGRGSYNCTAGGSSVFSDVPPGDAGCRFIHFLAAEGVAAGCGGGAYCPWSDLTRAQMAVFMTSAFELRLKAP